MYKGKLDLHLNTHLKLKPFKCRMGCDVGFAEKGNRRQQGHQEKIMMEAQDEGVKPTQRHREGECKGSRCSSII